MQFSIGCEYAVHGLLFLAMRERDEVVLVSDIAKAQNLPESYLAKVFQSLARAGLLKSFRGAKGGFQLGRLPEEITLRDVTLAVEGSAPLFKPLSQKRDCQFEADCLIRAAFKKAETSLFTELEKVTLKQMVDKARAAGDRLKWLNISQSK
jgi:Rrf2 family protein